jgi:hypothetical protein
MGRAPHAAGPDVEPKLSVAVAAVSSIIAAISSIIAAISIGVVALLPLPLADLHAVPGHRARGRVRDEDVVERRRERFAAWRLIGQRLVEGGHVSVSRARYWWILFPRVKT